MVCPGSEQLENIGVKIVLSKKTVALLGVLNSQLVSLMACLNTLKQEIRTLEGFFSKNHERFQIVSASVDELSCRFIGKNGKKYEIHANITVRFRFS